MNELVTTLNCDFNGENCQSTSREEKFSEGDNYEGIDETFLFDYLEGKKLCFKKGSVNYYDISSMRELFSENSDQVGCNPAQGSKACGGSLDQYYQAEYSYCYNSFFNSREQRIQDCPV